MKGLYRVFGFESKNLCIHRRSVENPLVHLEYYSPVEDVYFDNLSDALTFCSLVLGDWPWSIMLGLDLVARSPLYPDFYYAWS